MTDGFQADAFQNDAFQVAASVASTTEGRSGKRRRRPNVIPPEPAKENEDWIPLIL